jgi:hypothetical protein
MAQQELVVIDRTFDLVQWTCLQVGRFPRHHRYTLGERIEQRFYTLFETLLEAKYTRDRQALLRRANFSIEVLRRQLRLAHAIQCLRTNSYTFATQELHEIGAMVGGWLKASGASTPSPHSPGSEDSTRGSIPTTPTGFPKTRRPDRD